MFVEDSPPYTVSSPAPSYSREPSADEERLEFTRRSLRRDLPTGSFIKRCGGVTVTLFDQDDRASVPMYEQNSTVNGAIFLEHCDGIYSVEVKLECRLEFMLSMEEPDKTKILSNKSTLWKRLPGKSCPAIHTFACKFPSAFKARYQTQQLPPSFKIDLPRGFSAHCLYSLTVTISKTGNPLAFWREPEIIKIVLDYRHRSSAPRPITVHSLSSTVKTNPEEWFQIISEIQTRRKSGIQPIACNLFIPAAQIYGLSDTIPFHVQLSASLSSLRALVAPPTPSGKSTQPNSDSSSLNATDSLPGTIDLRVFLSREISMEVFVYNTKRICDLGQAQLRALPPVASSINSVHSEEPETVLNWEGEVRCGDIPFAGFSIDTISVKDFIVVCWTPPHPRTSPILPFRHAHPIKLVTDSYAERS